MGPCRETLFLFQLHFTKGGVRAALPLTFQHFEVADFSGCLPNALLHRFVQPWVSFQTLKSVWSFAMLCFRWPVSASGMGRPEWKYLVLLQHRDGGSCSGDRSIKTQ